jgi:hypothetical protein
VSHDSLGYWLAHELGHLAANNTSENDANRAAREYRKRLRGAAQTGCKLKGIIMKRTIAALLLTLGLVVGSAHGQTGSPGIKVTVPFRFVIGRAAFSAGEYSIFSSRDKVWVQEASGRNVAVLFTGALDGRVPVRDGRVIFDCYSGECFLSQVWIAGQETGRSLSKSKRQIYLASAGVAEQFTLSGRKRLN